MIKSLLWVQSLSPSKAFLFASSKTEVINIRSGIVADVYIGRSGKGKAILGKRKSILGNPYSIGIDGDRENVIRKYAYDFVLKWNTEPEFKKAILACEGTRLGCFCKPELCHGDVIVTFLVTYRSRGEKEALDKMHEIAEVGISAIIEV